MSEGQDWLVVSERLVLRPFKSEDLEVFLSYYNDPHISKFQGWSGIIDRAQAKKIVDNHVLFQLKNERWTQVSIQLKEGGHIGNLGLKPFDDLRQVDMGYTFAREFQGKGYATEAVKTMMKYLFSKKGVHRIAAYTDVDNLQSIKLMERIGMRREAVMIKSFFNNGEWRDEYQYAILKSEFNFT